MPPGAPQSTQAGRERASSSNGVEDAKDQRPHGRTGACHPWYELILHISLARHATSPSCLVEIERSNAMGRTPVLDASSMTLSASMTNCRIDEDQTELQDAVGGRNYRFKHSSNERMD